MGLGVFKLKYFWRCGDGSEVCFVLLVLRCLCYYYERVVFYIVWCIDKYLGWKLNYMIVCERYILYFEIFIIIFDYYVGI